MKKLEIIIGSAGVVMLTLASCTADKGKEQDEQEIPPATGLSSSSIEQSSSSIKADPSSSSLWQEVVTQNPSSSSYQQSCSNYLTEAHREYDCCEVAFSPVYVENIAGKRFETTEGLRCKKGYYKDMILVVTSDGGSSIYGPGVKDIIDANPCTGYAAGKNVEPYSSEGQTMFIHFPGAKDGDPSCQDREQE
jgi:hypothetical protein